MHKNLEDLTGAVFGEWTILGYLGQSYWLCKCSCGVEKKVHAKILKNGSSTSCGHSTRALRDITGQQFGEWTVLGKAEYKNHRQYWKCVCSCGKEAVKDAFTLTSGHSLSCGHSRLVDISGRTFYNWTVLEYAGNKKWRCKCGNCGLVKDMTAASLYAIRTNKCNHQVIKPYTKIIDIKVGDKIGEWTVLEQINNKYYRCKCSCGLISSILKYDLVNGKSKSCGHGANRFRDITGQVFGELTATKYIGDGLWECKCSCGRTTKHRSSDLINNNVTHCNNGIHYLKYDLSNLTFGELTATKYIGSGLWECKCSCGNTVNIYSTNLLSGGTRSCGCKTSKMRLLSINDKMDNKREHWQIDTLNDKEKCIQCIKSLGFIPTAHELAELLNISYGHLCRCIKAYDIQDLVDLNPSVSKEEKQLKEFVATIYDREILDNCKGIINGYELDIYLPDIKTAIEFNGLYWHSEVYKDVKYHQRKTVACGKAGIRLIHIFEYEWINAEKQDKIKEYLKSIICSNSVNKIYARKTSLELINNAEAKEFEAKNHLQGEVNSEINIGLRHCSKLVALMTFGKPRFSGKYQWEMVRLCYKQGIRVIGGAEKLFKYFVDTYKPTSILSYCDLSKFYGSVYTRLGFKLSKDTPITTPNYVWVNFNTCDVLKRYQTQKKKLVDFNIGDSSETETEIMHRIGYYKIYDSGNFKFEWNKE